MNSKKLFFTKDVFAVALTIVIIAVALLAIFWLRTFLILLFAAFLIALAVAPPIRALHHKTRWPLFTCGVLIYVLLIALIACLVILVIPALIAEVNTLATQFNLYHYLPSLASTTTDLSQFIDFLDGLDNWRVLITTGTVATFRGLVYTLAVIIISFYLSLGKNRLAKFTYKITGRASLTSWVKNLVVLLEDNLGGWVRCRVVLMLCSAVLVFLMLSIFGVPFALSLAILAGILDLVAIIGPLIAGCAGVIIALSVHGIGGAVVVGIFYTIVGQVEMLFIAPKLFKAGANVSPVVSILGILCGYQVAGVTGAILAIPVIVAARTIILELGDLTSQFGATASKTLPDPS